MPNAYKKTIQAELKAITAVLAGAQDMSSELAVATALHAMLFIDFGLDSAGTPPGTEFLVLVSQQDSGDDTWRVYDRRITGISAPSAVVTDGIEAAGAQAIECGATVPALGDAMLFKNAVLANSEWSTVAARVTTGGDESFTLRHALKNEQAQGTYYNKAEHLVIPVPLEGIRRMRVHCNNNYGASPVSCVWRCACILTESVQVVA
jgi:hypothetical protein